MKLTYHTGNNFGDKINPLIFKTLLPGFFDANTENLFLGIGSILGLKRPGPNVKNVIVFSSGFAGGNKKTYGSLPSKNILKKYDFRCVRGPLTARSLNLSPKYSICDGAVLISEIFSDSKNTSKKKYKYSYMPHIGTLKYFFGWEKLVNSLGIQFINPTDDIDFIIDEIRSSEVLFSEAMHGAIVADALRVPWLPIKSKKTVNEFKWKDFCHSLNMEYKPHSIDTLYNYEFMNSIVGNKIKTDVKIFTEYITKSYLLYQDFYLEKKVSKQLNHLKNKEPKLSNTQLLNSKREQLLTILEKISKDYSKNKS